jgi:hypothetical protein
MHNVQDVDPVGCDRQKKKESDGGKMMWLAPRDVNRAGVLELTAEEFVNMCKYTMPQFELKVVDGHVFLHELDGSWVHVPMGYVGYNKPIKTWPKDE